MNNGLEVHSRGYNFSLGDCLLSGITFLSGAPYAKRHWELSQQSGCQHVWGHRFIALLEAIPVIGGCVALIERVIISVYNKFFNQSQNSKILDSQNDRAAFQVAQSKPKVQIEKPLDEVEKVSDKGAPQIFHPTRTASSDRFGINVKKSAVKGEDFFKKITPMNIEDTLNVNEDLYLFDDPKYREHFINLMRSEREGEASYNGVYHHPRTSEYPSGAWTGVHLDVRDGQFEIHQNGTRDTVHHFDNLWGCLCYFFKGGTYQAFPADYYVLHDNTGAEIICKNPFRYTHCDSRVGISAQPAP